MAGIMARPWRITSCWLAKKWMTPSPLPSSIPMTFGRKKDPHQFPCRKLQVRIFKKGVQCYTAPSLEEIRSYSAAQMDTLWDEIKRF